jgi:hypothetical protein
MVLYATVIPYNSIETEKYEFSQETLNVLINFAELIFIRYSLQVRNTFQEKEAGLKVLSVGLSWSLADSVFTFLLYFLMNATGEEFKWEYIQAAIQSNFDLIDRIAVVALVECYEELKKRNSTNIHIIILLLSKYFITGLGFKYIDVLRYEDPWSQLICKGAFSLVFAWIVKFIFNIIFREVTEEELAYRAYLDAKSKRD